MGGPPLRRVAFAFVLLSAIALLVGAQDNYTMPECPPPGCPSKTRCTVDQRDKCSSRKCSFNKLFSRFECAEARCDDGIANLWETAVDCGGDCKGCPDNAPCFSGQDCRSGVCRFRNAYAVTVESGSLGGSCRTSACTDLVGNGAEPDIDCGDTACCAPYKVKRDCPFHCPDGFKCNNVYDCKSERCYRNIKMNGDRFCAAPKVSDSKPEFSTRIQGGTTVFGPKKLFLDTQPVIKALAFMLDIPPENIVMDALTDVQRPREYGNTSYLSFRLAKGWRPGFDPNARRRQLDERALEDGAGVAEEAMDVDEWEEVAAAARSAREERDLREAGAAYNLSSAEVDAMLNSSRANATTFFFPGAAQTPEETDDGEALRLAAARLPVTGPFGRNGTGRRLIRKRVTHEIVERGPVGPRVRRLSRSGLVLHDDVDEGGSAVYAPRRGRTRDAVEAPGAGNLPEGNSASPPDRPVGPEYELAFEMGAGRDYADPHSETEFERRLAAIYGPEALTAHRDAMLRADFDGLTLDTTRGGARALQIVILPPYNLTTTDTVIGVSVRYMVYVAPYEATLVADRMTRLLNISLIPGGWAAERRLAQELAWAVQDKAFCLRFAANFTLGQFNGTGVDCSPYIIATNTTNGTSTAASNDTAAEGGGGGGGGGRRRLLDDVDDESSADDGDRDWPWIPRLSSPLDASYLQTEDVARHLRAVGAGEPCMWVPPSEGRDGHVECAGDGPPPAPADDKAFSSTGASSAAGASRLGGMSSAAPRDLQASSTPGVLPGVPRVAFRDMLRFYGLNFDASRGVAHLADGSLDSNSDPPSIYFQPASLVVLQDPRGTPSKPMYKGVKFPVQPTVGVLDRHGRLVTSLMREMKITAFLDNNLFPPERQVFLSGFKTPTVQASGIALYDDLEINVAVQGVIINFTATFVTSFNQRLVLTGHTRPFDVIEPPPEPVVVYVRTPLHPAIVAFLAVAGAMAVTAASYLATFTLRYLRTPKPKAELNVIDRSRRGGKSTGMGVAYAPNRDLDDDDDDDDDDDEDGNVTEEEEVYAEPPPPLYTDRNVPGIGPSFAAAFGHLEDQLRDVEEDMDADDAGEADAHVRNELRRYERDVEPEVLAAQREILASAMVAETKRAALAAKRIDVSLRGHHLFSIPTGRMAAAVLDVIASTDRKYREARRQADEAARRVQIADDVRDAMFARQSGPGPSGDYGDEDDWGDEEEGDGGASERGSRTRSGAGSARSGDSRRSGRSRGEESTPPPAARVVSTSLAMGAASSLLKVRRFSQASEGDDPETAASKAAAAAAASVVAGPAAGAEAASPTARTPDLPGRVRSLDSAARGRSSADGEGGKEGDEEEEE